MARAGAAARAAVLAATDTAELVKAVELLDAFMVGRARRAAAAAAAGGGGEGGGDRKRGGEGCLRGSCGSCGVPSVWPGCGARRGGDRNGDDTDDGGDDGSDGSGDGDDCRSGVGCRCDCWRRDTWYRRHRNDAGGGVGPSAGPPTSKSTGGGACNEGAALRRGRKEQRREKYRAMGYNGL